MKEPIIAIVGRPNVGKSTLFNKIIGKRKAVVRDEAGITRDRNYERVERFSIPFYLIDTGGFENNPEDDLTKQVVEQTLLATEEADIVFCLFDLSIGLHPEDSDIVSMLRKAKNKVIYIANKCDGAEQAPFKAEFYSLGLSEIEDISALCGRGVVNLVENTLKGLSNYSSLLKSFNDLKKEKEAREKEAREALKREVEKDKEEYEKELQLELEKEKSLSKRDLTEVEFSPVYVPDGAFSSSSEYVREFKVAPPLEKINKESLEKEPLDVEEVLPEIDCIKVAIVGRPNAGKSTLLNTLLGEKRAITSDISGTTRDLLDKEITRDGQKYLLVDTAGLRKKSKVSDKVERYSTIRAINAVRDADVVLCLLDVTREISEQDSKILAIAHDAGKGIVIVVNKWDAVKKDYKSVKEKTDEIRNAFKFCRYAPIVFISALSGKRCPRVITVVKEVAIERIRRVNTGSLNRALKRAHKHFSPPSNRGRPLKLFFASQINKAPPTFILFFNYSRSLHFSYLRFLKNSIRKEFGFIGTDIKLIIRKRGKRR